MNSSPSSPFFQRLRHHDSEEDHGQNQKKSVLTKVKEKAKKLRHSLSKRKHEDGNPTSPSSATGVEGDGAEEDAEYLGAPSNKHHHTTPHSLIISNICLLFLMLNNCLSQKFQCTNRRSHLKDTKQMQGSIQVQEEIQYSQRSMCYQAVTNTWWN